MDNSNPLKFNGSLGEYEIIETSDGSTTVFSGAFNEACHSSHGVVCDGIRPSESLSGSLSLLRYISFKVFSNQWSFSVV